MELTRSYIFTGFPWGIVAYAWIDSPAIIFVSWLGSDSIVAVAVAVSVSVSVSVSALVILK